MSYFTNQQSIAWQKNEKKWRNEKVGSDKVYDMIIENLGMPQAEYNRLMKIYEYLRKREDR
jgi:hypothetical protein